MNWRVYRAKTLSLALAALLALPPAAFAATPRDPAPQSGLLYLVNSTGNGGNVGPSNICDDGTGKCTLRAAIEAANAHPGADGIRFNISAPDPNCAAGTGQCTIDLPAALPDITDSVSIVGPGVGKLTVRRNVSEPFRVFNVTTAGEVTLSGMTINNGNGLGGLAGGGIHNAGAGTVNVNNCVLSENVASLGGGIANTGTGTVNVNNSTLSGNRAEGANASCCLDGFGGAIFVNSGTVRVTRSTLSGNSTTTGTFMGGGGLARGGGIYNHSGVLHVVNSTIYGNSVTGANGATHLTRGEGGGVAVAGGTTHISNSTIVANTASGGTSSGGELGPGLGGGIFVGDSDPFCEVKSTLLAGNTASAGQDVWGELVSQGYNFFGDASDATVSPSQATDIFGGAAMLGPFQFHGGPTRTVSLLPGSPAIDKGTSAAITGPLSTDQRGAGFPRTVNNPFVTNAQGADGTDIGAFEAQPTVRFSSAAYSVNEGSPSAAVTVRLSAAMGGEATVRYATGNGTALAGHDYAGESGALTFAPGETTKTFTVPITDDTLDEADETVSLTLSNPSGGLSLGTPSNAVLRIVDDDPTPKLSINNVSVTEGSSGYLTASFAVTLSAASGKTVTAKYATGDGTAKAPGDYAAKTGTLTFLPGQTSKTVGIAVKGDALDEADETFFVNLSAPVNATLADAQGLCTVTDNDPPPSLRINDVSVTEVDANTSNVTLTVTLSRASARNIYVNYATANGSASSSTDYVSKTGTLSFTAGQTARTIVVQVRGDTLDEANETFFVNLSGAVSATIADAQGRVTILNDD